MDWTDISLEEKDGSSAKPEDEIKVEVVEEDVSDVVEGDPPDGDVDADREEKERRETRAQRLKRQRDDARNQNLILAEKLQALETQVGNLTKTQEEAFRIGQERFKESVKAQKANLEKEWKDAYDVGDKDRILDIQRQITRLDLDEEKTAAPLPKEREKETPRQREAPKADPRAQSWWKENKWFDPRTEDPIEAAATAFALKRSQALVEEGYDPTSDEYYEEIDKSVSQHFPALKKVEKPGKKAPPVTGGGRGSAAPSGNKVRLSPDEVRAAQDLGVDLQTYAKRKREIEVSKENGGYTVITL